MIGASLVSTSLLISLLRVQVKMLTLFVVLLVLIIVVLSLRHSGQD